MYQRINQWHVASLQPPHLAAMCIWEGAADWYRDMTHHGGILSTFWENWYDMQVRTVQHGLAKRGPTSKVTGRFVPLSTSELPCCTPTYTSAKVTVCVPKALESRIRVCGPQMSGRTMSRNDWSRAPWAGCGNTPVMIGCADGLPTGYGPWTEPIQLVTHFMSVAAITDE